MKNPHGVEPTRYWKRENSKFAIGCMPDSGPIFCGNRFSDIMINDNCNKENSCIIWNNGCHGFDCHSEYKSSLFVKTEGPNERNRFTVLDYEVYAIDYENKVSISKLCKYPDIICEYLENKDISEESLKQIDDDTDILTYLSLIPCTDNKVLEKIWHYCFKNPSEFLPDTQLVNKQYDDILREWLGSDYKWRLIYRASEHGYTAESFHKCCDNKGPTLIVIKSTGGWIFGGYATLSWSGWRIYYLLLEINR